jgi:hypothetical protein
MKDLIIRIPSSSPQEDRMTFVRAILNSLRCQREENLPIDLAEHNAWLIQLAEHLLPSNEEMMKLGNCLEERG